MMCLCSPLSHCVLDAAKERIRAGGEPKCLLDFWMVGTVKEIDQAIAANQERPPHSSDEEVANITLDFLFASQDASTASLTWVMDTLCRFPEVRARVQAEQRKFRPNREPITLDLLSEMKYTWQVMREILRHYPPATMVPHIANQPVKLGDYDVPTGSLIIPSIYSACHQGYSNPDTFDPDRYSPERGEDKLYDKDYFMTFGTGPHYCMGRQYAMHHLSLFLSILASDVEMEREWNTLAKECKMLYAPTIYPADECRLTSLKVLV